MIYLSPSRARGLTTKRPALAATSLAVHSAEWSHTSHRPLAFDNTLLTKAAQRAPGGHRHWETPMSIESLTYAELGDRLGTSVEAARSLARRLRLPRKPGNDG